MYTPVSVLFKKMYVFSVLFEYFKILSAVCTMSSCLFEFVRLRLVVITNPTAKALTQILFLPDLDPDNENVLQNTAGLIILRLIIFSRQYL